MHTTGGRPVSPELTGEPTGEPTARLIGEVLVLDDIGPSRRSRMRAPAGTAILWLVPAVGFLGLVLGWPAVATLWASFAENGELSWGTSYLRALRDPQLRRDLANTGIWAVAVPVVVTTLGYLLAVLSRRVRAAHVFGLVLVPMSLPLVVTGVAFRLLYDPSPSLGPATALVRTAAGWVGTDPDSVPPLLGPELVTGALMSAFVWAWVGLAVVVFRTALDGIPQELEDAARAEGADSWRVLCDVRWPFLRRAAAILVVLVAVAASRTFDLVLVMAPGSVQDRAEVLALYILRESNQHGSGEAAAVGVVWLLVVAVGALLAARWAWHDWPSPLSTVRRPTIRRSPTHQPTADQPAARRPQPSDQRRWRLHAPAFSMPRPGRLAAVGRVARWLVLALAVALWVLPVALLVLTSLHDPVDPATRGWLAPLSWASYTELFRDTQLGGALLPTAAMAAGVTVVVMVTASLAAYTLAWLRPPGAGAATLVLLVSAVVPIQAVQQPLQDALTSLGLHGSVLALAVVHIGRGVPFAVLVLRNAFAAVPADRVRRERLRTNSDARVLGLVVVPAARPALVAVAALQFILVWNDLVVGFLFGGPEFVPVGMVLSGQGRQFVTSAGVLAAGSVVASILPVVVVLLARRSIVSGLVSGVVHR